MHFRIGVITKNGIDDEIDSLLAPFSEYTIRGYEIYQTKEEFIKDKREQYLEYFNSPSYQSFKQDGEVEPPLEAIFKSLEDVLKMDDKHFYKAVRKIESYSDDEFDKKGNFVRPFNPWSRFEDFAVGCRYENTLRLKNDNYVTQAKCSEINLRQSGLFLKEYSDAWDIIVELGETITTHHPLRNETKEKLIGIYQNKTKFLQSHSVALTDSIVLPNGKWVDIFSHSGKLSFPSLDEVKRLYRIMDKYTDYYFTIIDCKV